jgi:hypothetical protein
VAQVGFQMAKVGFATLDKDAGYSHAFAGFDEGVHVHELPAQSAGYFLSYLGLAGAHETGKDQII